MREIKINISIEPFVISMKRGVLQNTKEAIRAKVILHLYRRMVNLHNRIKEKVKD